MRYLLFLIIFILSTANYALTLLPSAPARYVVKSGDTLWDIANRYLTYPWEWQVLWHANPKIKNPNRLYPGAILELHSIQHNSYIKVLSNGTIKLSPYIRPMPLEDAVPPLSLHDIKPFLDASLVLDRDTLTHAPYIVAFMNEHLLGVQGDEVYVKDLCPPIPPPGKTHSYGIYRPCGVYTDPVTKCSLGYKASLVGYGELIRRGDPATIQVTDLMQGGIKLQDRVMPNNHPEFNFYFEPKAPSKPLKGLIIDLPGDYTQGAVGLVVVLNLGKNSGAQEGDVLAVFSPPKDIRTPRCRNCVTLPAERIGEVMIFRTFSRTSFALAVRSIRAIRINDVVVNP